MQTIEGFRIEIMTAEMEAPEGTWPAFYSLLTAFTFYFLLSTSLTIDAC